MPWITLSHHARGLKHCICDFRNWKLLMICLFSWDDWGIWRKHEMDPGIWYKVGLELSNVHIDSPIKSQWSSQGRYDLRYQSVQIGISWPLNIKGSSAYVIDSFIVQEHRHVCVFKQRMSREDTVIRLHNCRWNLQKKKKKEVTIAELLALI